MTWVPYKISVLGLGSRISHLGSQLSPINWVPGLGSWVPPLGSQTLGLRSHSQDESRTLGLGVSLCSSYSSSSHFSASLIRNIEEFGAKNYFTNYQAANTIQLFVPIKRNFFGSVLFQNNLRRRESPTGYLISIATSLFA